MSVTDAELRDYLEGLLAEDAAKRIEAAMLADPSIEARLMAMDELAGEAPLPEDGRIERVATEIAPAAPATAPRRACISLAAAAAIGVLVGWGGGAVLTPGSAGVDDWRMEIAHYQALYTGDAINVSAAEAQAALAGA